MDNDKSLLDTIIELWDKAAKCNAAQVSITVSGIELIGGWSMRMTVARPGVLEGAEGAEGDDE